MANWAPPDAFDGYRLVRRVGGGRMGHVYLAEDTMLHRPVAVKFLAESDPNSIDRERLLLEARAIARLQHPNVVAIYRVAEVDGHPYLVSEFVRGEPLDRLARPVPPERLLQIAAGLARGLANAHRAGVMHRDIKPANAVLSEDGEAKLLDFGLAKLVDPMAKVTALPVRPADQPKLAETNPAGKPAVVVQLSASPGSSPRTKRATPTAVVPPANLNLLSDAQAQTLSFVGAVATAPSPANDVNLVEDDANDDLTLTRPGQVMGTPLYMAPEIWRGEAASFRSDIYSLGALLYQLATGKTPHERGSLLELRQAVLNEDLVPLAKALPALDSRLAATIDRCLHRDPRERFPSGDELRQALDQLAPDSHALAVPEGNPYRGLNAFEAEHRGLFFGREGEIRAVLERLRNQAFVLVAGDSGVGKSSLCRAGVIPAIRDGALRNERTWTVVTLMPGRRPLQALAAALAPHLATDEEQLINRMAAADSALGRELRKQLGDHSGLVIFVDQLEELVTLGAPQESAQVARILSWLAAPTPGVAVLATVRGDFLTRVAALPGVGEDVVRSLFILRPMSREHIREAVTGPARVKGVGFESKKLVDVLVESTAQTEAGLPLLQFALAELWDARDTVNKTVPEAALQKLGGVEGALARHADGVVDSLLPAQRLATRRVMVSLVTSEGTRTRRTAQELAGSDPEARTALEALTRGRLLVARESPDGTAVYEVAHEALLKGWPTMRGWLDQDRETREIRERLVAAVADWERLKQRDLLWTTSQMKEAEQLPSYAIGVREQAFLKASSQAIARARRIRNAAIAMVPVMILAVYGGVRAKAARDQTERIHAQIRLAEDDLRAAHELDRQVDRVRDQAFARFDAKEMPEGEVIWSKALAMAAQVDRQYSQIGQALEATLLLDPTGAEVRGLLGDVLIARVRSADRDGRKAQRDELLQRLSLYDTGGERRREWTDPAHLRLTVDPPTATVAVDRYVIDAQGRRVPEHVSSSRADALTELPPDSYLLRAEAPERVSLLYPLLLTHGESVEVRLQLPSTGVIPEGFVLVPEGRFLFGTGGDEGLRKSFYTNAPIHPLRTGPYLIQAHEVTYGEYLAFLDALEPADRTAHTPNISSGGLFGAVALSRGRDGKWTLKFSGQGIDYQAEQGQLIHYPGRSQRADQDWLRMPVGGVDYGDIKAYAEWLDRSGRVRGARPCSEIEWERGARGADDRNFPHGDVVQPNEANFDRTYEKKIDGMGPDAVGSYPASRSPFGLDDMFGNVAELASSSLEKDGVVALGGSFAYDDLTGRLSNRQIVQASLRDLSVGFRLCASWPTP